MQPAGDGSTAVSGSFLYMETFLHARAVKSHSRAETGPRVGHPQPVHLNTRARGGLARPCGGYQTYKGPPAGGQRHSPCMIGGHPTRLLVPSEHTRAPCSLARSASCVSHTPSGSGWVTHVCVLPPLPVQESPGTPCASGFPSCSFPVGSFFWVPLGSLCLYRLLMPRCLGKL